MQATGETRGMESGPGGSAPALERSPRYSYSVLSPESYALRCEGLVKRYGGLSVVAGLDLVAARGEVVALLGPSGCGKTTTLRLIAGFEELDAGTVEVGGRVVAGAGVNEPPERRRVGMVFQDYALFPHLSVARNVAFGLARAERGERAARVADALRTVGLDGFGDRMPHQLSGGQQQRVALARALAPTPELVLLDEPFSNLDAGLRERLREDVRGILNAAGVTALVVTHDQEEALSLAQRVAVMRAGRIEQHGTPEEVYSRPATPWVAAFLGDVEVLPGEVREGRAICELGSLPASGAPDGPAEIRVRPESLVVGTGPAGSASAQALVVDRRFYGHDQLLRLQLPSGQVIRSRRLGFPAWHPGDRISVWIDGPADVVPAGQRDTAQ